VITVIDAFRMIEQMFPDENDPDRYECIAFLHQRLAYRATRQAETLRALARRPTAGGAR
jgi:hypothetical protein